MRPGPVFLVVTVGCGNGHAIAPGTDGTGAADSGADSAILKDAGAEPTGEGETSTTGQGPCNDGTGATDCCAGGASGPCPAENICWSACNFASAGALQGTRSELSCSNGQWTAGHGLFPCSKSDASH
jgi:hypothetical protein